MDQLFYGLFQLIVSALPRRLGYVICGLVGVGCGVLFMRTGIKVFLIGGAFLAAFGLALVLIGITLRGSHVAINEQETISPSDEWRPPDGEDVQKIVRGRTN